MTSALRHSALLVGSLSLAACSGEPVVEGLNEPIRISSPDFEPQLQEGELPGLPPLTADEINAGQKPKTPNVSGINLASASIPPREPARVFSGLASPDSVAIGVRLAGLGSGYWVLPTGAADAVNDGALEWKFFAAFGGDLPPGKRQMLFAGIDAQGRSGNQQGLTLCLQPEVPDNGNACDPTQAPPAFVVSLGWDAAIDLDLRVITPTGKVVDSKHPTTAEKDEDGKLDPSAEGVGAIDHDSFANCAADGRRRENLVFQEQPPAGTYLVYANLYDACDESGAGFDVSLHVATTAEDGETQQLTETFREAGLISAIHANGGAKLGLFVTSFDVAP
ncbi:MAG TPA: hypothetical protein VIW29_01550 [Polyangiaceae bacterium]